MPPVCFVCLFLFCFVCDLEYMPGALCHLFVLFVFVCLFVCLFVCFVLFCLCFRVHARCSVPPVCFVLFVYVLSMFSQSAHAYLYPPMDDWLCLLLPVLKRRLLNVVLWTLFLSPILC